MSIRTISAGLVVAMLSGGAASAATIVQNGSFEDVAGLAGGGTNRGGYGVYDAIPGWTRGVGAGIELQNNATLGTHDAQDGNWYVELDSDSNSSMYQDITFASAGSYLLSFFYSPRTATQNDNGIGYSLGDKVDGLIDAVYQSPATWTQVTKSFTVDAGEVLRLSFFAGGLSNSLGGFVDNVSIAPVPLPGSLLLLGGALAGSGAFASRRRKKAA